MEALEMTISFEVRCRNRLIRDVSLTVERLADELPQDAERNIQRYQSILEENGQRTAKVWYVNEAEILQKHLLSVLQTIIDNTNHEEHEIVVTKDPEGLLAVKNCYCEHCGRLFLEHYGPVAGIVKKCRSCGKMTKCSHRRTRFR